MNNDNIDSRETVYRPIRDRHNLVSGSSGPIYGTLCKSIDKVRINIQKTKIFGQTFNKTHRQSQEQNKLSWRISSAIYISSEGVT